MAVELCSGRKRSIWHHYVGSYRRAYKLRLSSEQGFEEDSGRMTGEGKVVFDGRKVFSRESSEGTLGDDTSKSSFGADQKVKDFREVHSLRIRRNFTNCMASISPMALIGRYRNKRSSKTAQKAGLGTLAGVLIPTCENMWGVLIFLRFYYIVGNAGVWQSFLIVFVSFLCALLTAVSLSAIATNGPIEEGGTYYLISRALGPKLGGSVGFMYYLGVALLAVLEALGAVEMLLFTFPELKFVSANRVIGAIVLSILCFLVYFGISFVSKLSVVFFAVVLYTMLSYYLGLFTAPRGEVPDNMTGLSWNTFKGNWNSGYEDGVSFSVVLAVFFPCFTGILSGADRAKALARPEKSIPHGTIGAVCISLVLYLSYMGLWAAVGTREYLLGELPDGSERGHGGGHGNLDVVVDVAFPLAILTQIGIIIASLAQAFQCLITSPRLLQAIAGDGVIPLLSRLSKTSRNGEPRAALLATTVLCCAAAMIGSLDAVAPLVSICFLTCYSALNFSCVVLSILNAPSWRPKWRFYHWSLAFLGFILCFGMNFAIKWYWAIVAVVVLVLLYIYIDYRQVEVDWGTGLGGLRLQLAVQSILDVGHEARYSVNWRPQLLCLCKPRSARGPDDHDNQEFLSFVSQLKKGRGLCVVTTILEGKLETMWPQIEAERLELENCMLAAHVTGFAKVLVAPSYKEGKTYAIQSSGLGSLEPNTLVLGWPNNWREDNHYHNCDVMLEILTECKAANKAVLLCLNLDEFPTSGAQQEGNIDVWWIVHDGGLLLMLAHLLQQHKVWRKCKLRVFTVAEDVHDPAVVRRNLKRLLEQVRIHAEVEVLELDESGLAPYTFDYTIRLEEARAFAEEIAQYRKAQEDRKKSQDDRVKMFDQNIKTLSRSVTQRPEVSEQNAKSLLRSVTQRPERNVDHTGTTGLARSKSGDRETLDNLFRDDPPNHQSSENTSVDAVPSIDKTVEASGISSARGSGRLDNPATIPGLSLSRGSGRMEHPATNSYVPDHSDPGVHDMGKSPADGQPRFEKTISGRNIDQIWKYSIPTEVNMLDEVPYTPRHRSGPLHFLKTAGQSDLHDQDGDVVPSPTSGRQWGLIENLGSFNEREEASGAINRSSGSWRMRRAMSGKHPDEVNVTTDSLPTPKGEKVIKGTRWADDLKEEGILEIVVHKDNDDEKAIETETVKPLVRKGSAGQLYPGSPHQSMSDFGDVDSVLPETNRTWETFSKNYSPTKLNDIIVEHSRNSSLVLLNLPDHYQGMEAATYMEYCEHLTEGLRRVVLVHGSGKELWGASNAS